MSSGTLNPRPINQSSSECCALGRQIDVSKNQVRSVKKNFYKPPVELNVSDNRLKKLPTAKSKKKNFIHSIDASHNSLSKLPPRVNSLVCMTRLDLSNNNLNEVRRHDVAFSQWSVPVNCREACQTLS